MTFYYTVLSGDSLSKIADEVNACSGVTVAQIEKANPNADPSNLQIGQLITIPASSSTSSGLKYTIRSGDSFSKIANEVNAASGVTYQQIEQANPGMYPDKIYVGQVIAIPAFESSQVGSSLSGSMDTSVAAAENVGYWHWTYHDSFDPPGTTMGIAFYGAVDPAAALQQSAKVKDRLRGNKYICLGGGTSSGSYDADAVAKIITAIKAEDFAGYQGIAFDIEVGSSGLEENFKELFSIVKGRGFKVLVTVSHSRPYGIRDGSSLMDTFFVDENIDFLSPQLYTTGRETSNDYTAYGIKWSDYAAAKAIVIPSIVKASYYADAVSYFKDQGVKLKGYVQWSQD